MPKQTVESLLMKALLNQIVLGPTVIAVVFAWNNLWQGKLAELPNKYKMDALPSLFFGFRFWILASILKQFVKVLKIFTWRFSAVCGSSLGKIPAHYLTSAAAQ